MPARWTMADTAAADDLRTAPISAEAHPTGVDAGMDTNTHERDVEALDGIPVASDGAFHVEPTTAGPEAGIAEATRRDSGVTLPPACKVLQVFADSARPRCPGHWPGTAAPCLYYCQPYGGDPGIFPDQESSWACATFSPQTHDNAGKVVCIGGGEAACKTYCPGT